MPIEKPRNAALREAFGNLWSFGADAKVITTNGFVKKNGQAVMGRGCALEAANMYSGLPALLGKRIEKYGNNVHIFTNRHLTDLKFDLITFPVKHIWNEEADKELIFSSTCQLLDLADLHGWQELVMPRMGCGNGGLNWELEVRPMVKGLLDDRFTVVTR